MFPILHLTEFCSHPSMMLHSYKSDGFILVLLVGCYRKSSASGDLMGKNQKLMFFFFLFLLSLSVFFFSLSPPFPPPQCLRFICDHFSVFSNMHFKFGFLHGSAGPCYIQTQCMWYSLWMLDFQLLCMTLKTKPILPHPSHLFNWPVEGCVQS